MTLIGLIYTDFVTVNNSVLVEPTPQFIVVSTERPQVFPSPPPEVEGRGRGFQG